MPATSKSQLRFMAGAMNGSIKKPGLSKGKAAEFVHATNNAKALPNKAKPSGGKRGTSNRRNPKKRP